MHCWHVICLFANGLMRQLGWWRILSIIKKWCFLLTNLWLLIFRSGEKLKNTCTSFKHFLTQSITSWLIDSEMSHDYAPVMMPWTWFSPTFSFNSMHCTNSTTKGEGGIDLSHDTSNYHSKVNIFLLLLAHYTQLETSILFGWNGAHLLMTSARKCCSQTSAAIVS